MAVIKAFRGFRPPAAIAPKVVSRPYDAYTPEQIRRILAENPYCFLHVVQPDFFDKKRTKANTPQRFRKSKQRWETFVKDDYLVQDESPALYVYSQSIQGKEYTGIIGCAAVDDYLNNVIRKHENTLSEREVVLKEYLRVCDINAEPVCLTYRPVKAIKGLTD